MFRLSVLLAGFVLTVVSLPANLPEPRDLVFDLSEDEFEDYLDKWLEIEEPKWSVNASRSFSNKGCTFRVNGNLGQPQPVYMRNGKYLEPTRNTGQIHLNTNDEIYIACIGNGQILMNSNIPNKVPTATVKCHSGSLVYGGTLVAASEFRGLVCSSHSFYEARATTEKCYNNNIIIEVGFNVDHVFYPLYHSCFDENRLEVLYVLYEQRSQNAVHQTGVSRPNWLALSFYPDVAVNNRYTRVQHKKKIAEYVGDDLADKYVTNTQYLSRGHLAAKTDFVYSTGQRSTFLFINAAPQWQPFNGGNWNSLEQDMRARIGVAGYNTIIYTGTFGISQLRDQRGRLVDIYLHKDSNNNDQLPVPLYYYKVVYDPTLEIGTAFVGINSPYYTKEEVRKLTFCTDRCRNNRAFNWLSWRPDQIDLGYSFCCEIDDFRRTIPHLPPFTVKGLLA